MLLNKTPETVLYSQGELWVTYGQSSGQTTQMGSINRTFITDNSFDKNYDSLVPRIIKALSSTKPLKSKKNHKVYQISEYPYINMGQKYDIWDGMVKPISKKYITIDSTDTMNVINLFDTKNEALVWFRSIV